MDMENITQANINEYLRVSESVTLIINGWLRDILSLSTIFPSYKDNRVIMKCSVK